MYLVPKCSGTEMYLVPKCSGTEMYLVPKCSGTEKIWYRKKLVPKCSATEKSWYRNVPVPKSSYRNVELPKCSVPKCETAPKRIFFPKNSINNSSVVFIFHAQLCSTWDIPCSVKFEYVYEQKCKRF